MGMLMTRLVLLPGLDGTGDLFKGLVQTLPKDVNAIAVRYPANKYLSVAERIALVKSVVPKQELYVLLAESYSTPLAIQFAATNPPNLKGLILCVGFAASPVYGWRRLLCSWLSHVLFRFTIPEFALRHFLAGSDASPSLMAAVKASISSVDPKVLAARLREILVCDVREGLYRVAGPMLYIEALHDRLVPGSCSAEIQFVQLQMQIETIDGPHLILQREPERAAEIILEFLSQL